MSTALQPVEALQAGIAYDKSRINRKRLIYILCNLAAHTAYVCFIVQIANDNASLGMAFFLGYWVLALVAAWHAVPVVRRVCKTSIVALIFLGLLLIVPIFSLIGILVMDNNVRVRMKKDVLARALEDKTDEEVRKLHARERDPNLNATIEVELKRRGLATGATAGAGGSADGSSSAKTDAAAIPEKKPDEIMWEVKRADGSILTEKQKELRAAIMAGDVKGDWVCRLVTAPTDGKVKQEPKWISVEKSFDMFRPVRAHLWKGAAIGAGISLVLFFAFRAIDAGIAGLSYHIPKLVGLSVVYVFWLAILINGIAQAMPESVRGACASFGGLLTKGSIIVGILAAVNMGGDVISGIFMGLGGVFTSLIIGSLVGGLPGMAIGSTVGLIRRASLPMPVGAVRERPGPIALWGIALPVMVFVSGSIVYVQYVLPWANEALVDSLKK